MIIMGFSLTSTSPFPYHLKVDSPNTYHIILECQVRFWCYWEALEEARLWQMQLGVLQDSENQTRHGSEKSCWSRSLDSLGTLGRLGLGVFCYSCIPTNCLVDRLLLRGRRRGFTPSTSVSSSIIHRRVILCLHSSSLLFYLSFYCCVIMIMGQSSLFVYLLTFTLFCTLYKLE